MFASTWSTQPNQQPQQGGSSFGQPANSFGTGGFGSGNAFGQNTQPQTNPMFGNLAANPNPNPNPGTGTSGFGAFSGNATQAAPNPLFGGAKPAPGFGAFSGGGPSTFGGGGGTFGNAGNTAGASNIFGQPSNPSGFGASTPANMFGKSLTTGFGGAPGNTQAGAFESVPPVSTGTANPPFSSFSEKDNANTLQYQSISCMPQYRGSSHEELRLQDYAQGRKTAGAFGQSASFGTTTTAPPATNIFGAPQPQPANPFGGGNTNPSGNAFGAFGQNNNNAPTQPTSTTTGTGMFGAFGQPQPPSQSQPPPGFGAFGQNPQQPQPQPQPGTGAFGGGGFGANKPSAFGTFGGGGNAFGGGGGGGAFGAQPQQPQQPATTGGMFGQQPQNQTNAFGAFGANANNPKPSLFGTQPAAQTNTGFGAFGQQPSGQNQQQQPAGGMFGGSSLFNNNNQQPQMQGQPQANQPAGGIFGNAQPSQPIGMFNTGTGMFGSNPSQPPNTQQPQNNFTNLFNKPVNPTGPPNGGIFGSFGTQGSSLNSLNPAGQQNPLFGSSLGNQQSNLGSSAFGGAFGKPAPSGMGQSQSTMGQPGGGSGTGLWGPFGGGALNLSANNPGAQGTLTASISQPIESLPIFALLPPGPHSIILDPPKKKTGFFADIPTRTPVPRLQLGYTPAVSRLRGFNRSSTSASLSASSLGASGTTFSGGSLTSGKANVLTLDKPPTGASSGIFGRSSSPSLGSGGRQSVKKLVLDRKVDPSEFFNKVTGGGGGSKVTFSPALSIAAREKEAAAAATAAAGSTARHANGLNDTPTPAPRGQRGANQFTGLGDSDKKEGRSSSTDKEELREGDYWVKPELEKLKEAGYEELVSFKGLSVGRVGYGEVEFIDPVDLTGLTKLSGLMGEIVRFEEKECSVYPDMDEEEKPAPGSGLNVRARLSLLRCWAQNKATREAVKDEKDPVAVRHLKRLKVMKDTHFESWDMETGQWTFTVDHF